jgi:uncharacterized protein YjbI with pentapeptide repeats
MLLLGTVYPILCAAALSIRSQIAAKLSNLTFAQAELVIEDLEMHRWHIDYRVPHLDGNYTGIDLSHIIAHKAILEQVRLERANLSPADLSGSICCSSTPRQANLSGADCSGANMNG